MKLGDIVIYKPTNIQGEIVVLGGTRTISIRTKEGFRYKVDREELELLFKFSVGDRVVKFKGDYTAAGEVRSVYLTKAGKPRYVVEYDALPLQHIHSDRDLMREEDYLTNVETFGEVK